MDVGAIIFAICGFSLVCLGILAVIAFIVLRFAGGIFLGPLGELLGQQSPDDRLDDDYRPAKYGRRSSSRLREIRESLDFDPKTSLKRRPSQSRLGSDFPPPKQLRGGSLRSGRMRRRDEGEEIYDDEDGGLL